MTIPRGLRVASVLALVAAGALAQGREDTLILDLDRTIQDPENFNWFTDDSGVRRMSGAHQTMWEPLFVLDHASGALVPWLATGAEANGDFTEFTLTLRAGVAWSDGEAFDADDVVFTARMVLGNEALSVREAAAIREQVARVEKVDDLTVRFVLRAPNPRFVAEHFGVRIVHSFLVMPEHVWAEVEDPATYPFFPPIGTGPYEYVSGAANRMVWDRRDGWWGADAGFRDMPAPERVIFLASGGEEGRAHLMATNQMDAAHGVDLGTFEAIRARNPAVVAWRGEPPFGVAGPCPRQLEINTAVPPWDEPEMRRAVSLLVDRARIAEGGAAPSRSMFAETGAMEPFVAAVEAAGLAVAPEADVAAAQALIEGRGWRRVGEHYAKDGRTLGATIHANSASRDDVRAVDLVVEQMRRAGIDARAQPVETGVLRGEVLPFGAFEMSLSRLSCGSLDEPWSSMGRYTVADAVPVGERSPGLDNAARWDDASAEAYSAAVAPLAGLAPGDEAAPGIVAAAYAHLAEGMPFVPLVQSFEIVPVNTTYWTGWPAEADPSLPGHPFFWWGSAHAILHGLEKAGR